MKRYAVNIIWDTDGENVDLPTEIEIPDHLIEDEDISDFITEATGFCHNGFTIEVKKGEKIMEFEFNDEINERINEIVRLTDEKNYLENILEEADETGEDLELIIMNRIEDACNEIERLEKEGE